MTTWLDRVPPEYLDRVRLDPSGGEPTFDVSDDDTKQVPRITDADRVRLSLPTSSARDYRQPWDPTPPC